MDTPRPKMPVLFVVALFLTALTAVVWTPTAISMLGIGEEHSAKTILALGYPMYAVLSVYLAYRVYADRHEVSWLLIALVWLSLAAEWWLVFGAK